MQNQNTSYRLGLDIGSTTAKAVILDADNQIVFFDYVRHNADVLQTLQSLLQKAVQAIGDVSAGISLTGSAGMGVSERFELPFIQEVIACVEVVRQMYPEVKTFIDIGGEDAKMILFDENGPDIRMNGSCAGGTGAFLDQMATLINLPVEELNQLAEKHSQIFPIASRCGVFAKTDVQNLISREVGNENIAASVFQAVVLQTLATLGRGSNPQPKVLLAGGPLTFMPELRRYFLKNLKMKNEDLVQAGHTELLPAMGAAFAVQVDQSPIRLSDLMRRLASMSNMQAPVTNRLEPLFDRETSFENWRGSRSQQHAPRTTLQLLDGQNCFLGIDSGSTTTKLVLMSEKRETAFTYYCNNNGNAIAAVKKGLALLRQRIDDAGVVIKIGRTAVTGYGEDLIRAAFSIDEGMVETIAHFRAACSFDPQVSFILDIGGQDMKAIFVEKGKIRNIEINEACSSGCGSFIEGFARSMGYPVDHFAALACQAAAPYDLGTRCTVFMNSKVKQALREGAGVDEISAGLAYSVIKNAIHKVLKITDVSVLGKHVFVQGGTFRNPAVQRALERLLGFPVICPDIPELMGAYGAALTAMDRYQQQPQYESKFKGLELSFDLNYERRQVNCHGCQNQCSVTRLAFPNGNTFFTGNRCEKVFNNSGVRVEKGVNLSQFKNQLLFDRETGAGSGGAEKHQKPVIGIPRVLNLYENYPFWHTLFTRCGFEVHLSAPSSAELYQKGVGTIMSENICFPAKLAHGHFFDLMETGVDRIFYPMIAYENSEFADADNCYTCPIVAGYPEVVQSAINPQRFSGIPLDKPALTLKDKKLFEKGCASYFASLGVKMGVFKKAYREAWQVQDDYKQAVQDRAQQIIEKARSRRKPIILLLGRPYHIDPQINHGLTEIICDFGVDVITEDSIPMNKKQHIKSGHVISQWAYPNRYLSAVMWAREQPDVEVVVLNSFGCGPDVLVVDEVKSLLAEFDKSPTVIRIDEIESPGSVKLRLRSLIEQIKLKQAATLRPVIQLRHSTPIFEKNDRSKTILVPEFARFCTDPIVRPLHEMGYNMEVLPTATRESIELGLKYVNNEICYPAIVVIGDIIKALQSGKYDLKDVAVGISQTGGQCRDSCYLPLLKKALIAAGFTDVPVISVATNLQPINEQPGFNPNYARFAYQMMLGVAFTDSLSAMYHSTAPRELTRGKASQVVEKQMARLRSGEIAMNPKAILQALEEAVREFNAIPTEAINLPRVGIVGEIYVKYNDFANHNVVQWLMDQGLEVQIPPLLEYFTSNFVNFEVDVERHLKNRDWLWLAGRTVRGIADRFIREVDGVMRQYQYYHPAHPIEQLAAASTGVLDLVNHFGEGWLIPGGIGSLVQSGVNNILCLQPFGCIANHVVAKGISKTLKESFSSLNLLFLDLDAGLSEVNYLNRLFFFVNQAKNVQPNH